MGGCSIDFSRMDAVKRLSKEDHDITVQPGLGESRWLPLVKWNGVRDTCGGRESWWTSLPSTSLVSLFHSIRPPSSPRDRRNRALVPAKGVQRFDRVVSSRCDRLSPPCAVRLVAFLFSSDGVASFFFVLFFECRVPRAERDAQGARALVPPRPRARCIFGRHVFLQLFRLHRCPVRSWLKL